MSHFLSSDPHAPIVPPEPSGPLEPLEPLALFAPSELIVLLELFDPYGKKWGGSLKLVL